jgi:hypothetical protein
VFALLITPAIGVKVVPIRETGAMGILRSLILFLNLKRTWILNFKERQMKIDLKWALNFSVVSPRGENIGWWPMETDKGWWALCLWLRRN